MNVGIATLGCKVNQYESQVMMENLLAHGFEQADAGEPADVFIINSCTVAVRSQHKCCTCKMLDRAVFRILLVKLEGIALLLVLDLQCLLIAIPTEPD